MGCAELEEGEMKASLQATIEEGEMKASLQATELEESSLPPIHRGLILHFDTNL